MYNLISDCFYWNYLLMYRERVITSFNSSMRCNISWGLTIYWSLPIDKLTCLNYCRFFRICVFKVMRTLCYSMQGFYGTSIITSKISFCKHPHHKIDIPKQYTKKQISTFTYWINDGQMPIAGHFKVTHHLRAFLFILHRETTDLVDSLVADHSVFWNRE